MTDEHEVDAGEGLADAGERFADVGDEFARLDVRVGLGPIDTTTWKQPPPPDPCACPVFAVHRTGLNEPGGQGVRLASLPPGNVVLPPLAELYLAPGSYVVSANLSVTANFGPSGIVFAMLGTPSQGSMSWTWLRMPPYGSPGDGQIVHLQGVLTLNAGDRVGVDAYGGAQNYAYRASNIWLIAQKVGAATVFKL
jgi:hypothetical protein